MATSFKDLLRKEMTEQEFENMTHRETYAKIIERLGYNAVKQCIPFSLEQLKTAYKTDEHFNNLALGTWDRAAGFHAEGANVVLFGSPLTALYHKIGVNCFSCSDGVCILKNCAVMWVEETEKTTEKLS